MKKEPFPRKQLKVQRGINGLGLFTTEPMKKGTFIIEYVGELLTAAQADERGGQYLFEINSRWTIDGRGRDNLARYINHSCRPNCESDTNDREKRIEITAIKISKREKNSPMTTARHFGMTTSSQKGVDVRSVKKSDQRLAISDWLFVLKCEKLGARC